MIIKEKERFIMKNFKMEVLETLETPSAKDVAVGFAIGVGVGVVAVLT